MSSEQSVEPDDDRPGEELPDPGARWPTSVPPERGGITTSSPHAVPTVTPGEPGARPPAGPEHAESAAATAHDADGEPPTGAE
jgi:hypothetical protein